MGGDFERSNFEDIHQASQLTRLPLLYSLPELALHNWGYSQYLFNNFCGISLDDELTCALIARGRNSLSVYKGTFAFNIFHLWKSSNIINLSNHRFPQISSSVPHPELLSWRNLVPKVFFPRSRWLQEHFHKFFFRLRVISLMRLYLSNHSKDVTVFRFPIEWSRDNKTFFRDRVVFPICVPPIVPLSAK